MLPQPSAPVLRTTVMMPPAPSALRQLLFVAWVLLCGSPLAAEVTGVVRNSQRVPVESALVESVATGAAAVTDARGQFVLEGESPPLEIRVRHPRYLDLVVSVAADEPSPELLLSPKQEIFEEVVVSASRGESAPPLSIAATLVHPERRAAPAATLVDVVSAVPGVSENGQAGIFQTYSIRGIARQRVLTLISGMRIVSERRAGASASFLDPTLMGSVDVLRGPSSSYYGSGALGGVVQLFPRTFDGLSAAAGFHSEGNESYQTVGWGGSGWSVGLAHRRAGDSEAADGTFLASDFSQLSGVARKEWQARGLTWEVLAIGTAGRDIGKPNTRYPVRVTEYTGEDHLLLRLGVHSPGSWRFEAYVHPNQLDTRVVEQDRNRRSELTNEAFDLGFNWQRELRPAPGVSARVGVDYFGRREVTAEERIEPLFGQGPARLQRSLDGAEEDEGGAYGAVEWGVGRATLLAGGRFAWQRQSNAGGSAESDTAWNGFLGAVLPLGKGWEVSGNLGSGLRFPSLSERFFSGVTGRGQVTGNPTLEPERSLSLDLGVRWYGQALFVAGYLFRTEIDDYIERIEAAPGQLTFVNLTSGTVEGVEVEGGYRFDDAWSLAFGGHRLQGRDAGGEPLADVPADRVHLGASWSRGPWSAEGRLEHRFDKDDPGSGERAIPSAELASVSLSRDWGEHLRLTLSVRNLLDEVIFNSADDLIVPAAGRSVGVELGWNP